MLYTNIILIVLILANVVFSYKGFTNQAFFDGYKFEVSRILVNKDYIRLVTSGFLHINWVHLILNMYCLYCFAPLLIALLGVFPFLAIYFSSMIAGDLLALFIHRNHADYSAVGASGGICGLIFATISLSPYSDIGLIFLPLYLPGWIYGLIYVAFTIYAIRSKKDNIGHEAHLGGALVGMLIAILFRPSTLAENYLAILLILIPTLTFIYLIVTRPHILLVDNQFFKSHDGRYNIDQRYNMERANKQDEINRILDKINRRGINRISAREKDFLKRNS